MSGAATSPMKSVYVTSSPAVISLLTTDRPPSQIISTLMMPTMTVLPAVLAETPVIDLAMFRNSRCAPLVKTISSRFSAVYDLTMRMPPSDSVRRPVTSALILPRSRNSGRRVRKAYAIPPPNAASTSMVISVRCQFR